jgi:branched-chain amino acid aminotransferase
MKDTKKVVFGHEYTDHMLKIKWTKDKGWGTPRILPFENFKMHPAAKVLHYAVSVSTLD